MNTTHINNGEINMNLKTLELENLFQMRDIAEEAIVLTLDEGFVSTQMTTDFEIETRTIKVINHVL